MSSNSSTSQCSPSSPCREDASIMEPEQPSPPSSLNQLPSESPRRRNGNISHTLSTPTSSENDFPRLLFLDENCEGEEDDTFNIKRKLLRRRYVRREQNKKKKRQREIEEARQMERMEAEKLQSQKKALQSSPNEYTMEQTEQKQRLLQSPSCHVSCGIISPCCSPAINLPYFSPLRPTKRRNIRATY